MENLNWILNTLETVAAERPIDYAELANNAIIAFDKQNELIEKGIIEIKVQLLELLEKIYEKIMNE